MMQNCEKSYINQMHKYKTELNVEYLKGSEMTASPLEMGKYKLILLKRLTVCCMCAYGTYSIRVEQ